MRALSFERRYTVQDPTYTGDAIETYASRVRASAEAERRVPVEPISDDQPAPPQPVTDVGEARILRAVEALRADRQFMDAVQHGGAKWGMAQVKIKNTLPDTMVERQRWDTAYSMVKPVLIRLFGEENVGWKTESRAGDIGRNKAWIQVIGQPDTGDPHVGR